MSIEALQDYLEEKQEYEVHFLCDLNKDPENEVGILFEGLIWCKTANP
jgi:hypothetical protein